MVESAPRSDGELAVAHIPMRVLGEVATEAHSARGELSPLFLSFGPGVEHHRSVVTNRGKLGVNLVPHDKTGWKIACEHNDFRREHNDQRSRCRPDQRPISA